MFAPMKSYDEPGTPPHSGRRGCDTQRRKAVLACAAATLAVALVLVLGGEELNILAGGVGRQQVREAVHVHMPGLVCMTFPCSRIHTNSTPQAKLQADYETMADSLVDLGDMLPQMEANMDRMIDGLAGTVGCSSLNCRAGHSAPRSPPHAAWCAPAPASSPSGGRRLGLPANKCTHLPPRARLPPPAV